MAGALNGSGANFRLIIITIIVAMGTTIFTLWFFTKADLYSSLNLKIDMTKIPIDTRNKDDEIVVLNTIPAEVAKKDDTDDDFQLLIAQTKACILQQMKLSPSEGWIYQAVTVCSSIFEKSFTFSALQNKDEIKYVLLPSDAKTNNNCNVLTLGVGNDIGAEENLKKLFPACKFWGADPILASGKVYEKIGKYYNMAVGAKDGNFTASVLVNGAYVTQTVPYMSFDKFLQLTGINFVDYFLLDAEGAEYELLPILEAVNGKSKNSTWKDVKICQFNAELHLPLNGYGMNVTRFNEIMKSFITKTTFLPLIATGPHIRSAWLEMGDKQCVEKYMPGFIKTYTDNIRKTYFK